MLGNDTVARIGFVGCGSHATNNLYPMLRYARCTLDAVCDLDWSLASRNATLFGASHVYTDAERMLAERPLDGVFVVGPSSVHYEVGWKVLNRGIPLFTEKPPAPDLQSATEMVELARSNGVFLMPGYMKRHGLTYRRARELISSSFFDPAAGSFQYGHWPQSDLRSMLLGMCSHPIDLAISFFGPVQSVTSLKYQRPGAICLAVTMLFQSGKWAQLMLDSSQPRQGDCILLNNLSAAPVTRR